MIPLWFLFCAGYFGILLNAALFDLKNKWVPNEASYTLSVFGFALYFSMHGFTYLPFLGFALYFLFGLGLYYGHLWGGADVKIFAAAGAAFGPNLLYVFCLLVVSFLYGLLWWGIKRERQAPFVPVLFFSSFIYFLMSF